ncbi:MAG TPA: hypothetical protein VK557_02795 [Pyrinomonadaceae bacterium]|nr:hypothetical protein [Pyrinomonadaceae bacterium]
MSRSYSTRLCVAALALAVVVCSADARTIRPGGDRNRLFTTQGDGWTALKTDDGILFIWNRPGFGFTLSIKGKDIRPLNDPNNIFFTVDGLVFQIQSLPISNFAPDARTNKLDDKSILLAHRDWESKFLEDELLHSKLALKSSSEKLASGSDALLWQFDLPEKFKNPDAKTQMYLTIVAKDYVILLNSVVSASGSEAAVHKFLLDVMTSLKFSSEPIDVKKAQETIRKGAKP